MRRKCDHCGVSYHEDTLTYRSDEDEYWCDSCLDNEAEAAWERQQAADLESPPETMDEAHMRAWHEKRRLK